MELKNIPINKIIEIVFELIAKSVDIHCLEKGNHKNINVKIKKLINVAITFSAFLYFNERVSKSLLEKKGNNAVHIDVGIIIILVIISCGIV